MAQFISPIVNITENDKSFIQSGVSEIGAAIVGPTTKGPAFIPTLISSTSEYNQIFGTADGYSYVPYTVREYLNNASQMTVMRVLGLGGYEHDNIAHLVMSGSYGKKVISTFHRSTQLTENDPNEDLGTSTITHTIGSDAFNLHLEGTNTGEYTDYETSLDSTSANFISKLVKIQPVTDDVAYAYSLFTENISDYLTTDVSSSLSLEYTNLVMNTDYQTASTPWITSQTVGGRRIPLIKFNTISHGNNVNTEIKVTIDNIKFGSEVPGTDYGTFTVNVREIDDNDRQQKVLESYVNVSLDPSATNYITRIIGDKINTYIDGKIIKQGDFDNASNYITVTVADGVKNKSLSPILIPWGFKALKQPTVVPAGTNLPVTDYVTDQVYSGEYNSRIYYGFNFDFNNTDNKNYLMPIQENTTVGLNEDFDLDNYTINVDSPTDAGVVISQADVISARRFIIPFQGGFDGIDPATTKNMDSEITSTNSMGYDFSNSTAKGSVAYNMAYTLLSNTDIYDFNLLLTPGLIYNLHSYPVTRGIDLCETRGDAFYVMDTVTLTTNVKATASSTDTLDSNYTATYYPWVKILDVDNNVFKWCPPSVVVAGAISYNDSVGYEWFAPAGLNRGITNSVIETYVPLSQPDRDILYDARVNPIATFPREGIVIWGQKTLQVNASALDRINVRRLLINVKKFIASVGKYVLFEQNTRTTRNNLLNTINPYLDSIVQKNGIYIFKVQIDSNNNTGDVIDRNLMKGSIFLQPTKTAEFLSIDLNIQKTGTEYSS